MRISASLPLFAGIMLAQAGSALSGGAAAEGESPRLEGRWKLIAVQAINSDMFLISFNEKEGGGGITGEIKAAPGLPSERPKLEGIAVEGGLPRFEFGLFGGQASFVGASASDGKVYGALRLLDQVIPARLERTDAETLAGRAPDERERALISAMQQGDPKLRVRGIAEALDRGNPRDDQGAYGVLIGSASMADLPEEEVRRHVDAYVAGARAYGSAWSDHVEVTTLKMLTGWKSYARLALDLANGRRERLGGNASLEDRADVARARSIAAKQAGEADLAVAALAELQGLEGTLDAAYLKDVPSFKPKTAAPREDARPGRVVLLELFNGSHCAAGVANDVALDALAASYRPDELIALQYHVRVPSPDPLVNPDGQERKRYYGVRVIPSTFFNGKSGAPGGGPMSHAEGKYDECRRVIDRALGEQKQAEIDLKVSRAGDAIEITAEARVAADAAGKAAKPRLRLALVERRVRFAGENRVRFHREVVRALPGGAEGKELTDGRGAVDVVVNLGQLRAELREGLAESIGTGREPAIPEDEIGSDGLAVVAFVQDDETREVYHAAIAPVDGAK